MLLWTGKTWLVLLTAAVVGVVSCAKNEERPSQVTIVPAITRVTGIHFDSGDRIGLNITKISGDYVVNKMLTYDGAAFSNPDLLWYNNLNEKSTLTAYYPYSPDGVPSEFGIAVDQTTGCAPSDLLGAVTTDVVPMTTPVKMLFYHLMSQVTIVVTNNSDAAVTGITLGGLVPVAEVDLARRAAGAKSGAMAAEVKAFPLEGGVNYRAILVPQTADLVVSVLADDGKVRSRTIAGAVFQGGKRHDLAVSVSNVDIKLTLSGEVSDWEEGPAIGDDGGDGSDSGPNSGGELLYEGQKYRTATIAGREWMVENLRYMPAGAVLGNGVWNPIGGPTAVGEQGLLYNRATVAGSATTKNLPVRGICPPGWHIPDSAELETLVDGGIGDYFTSCAGCWAVRPGSQPGHGAANKGILMSSSLVAESGNVVTFSYLYPYANPTMAQISPEYGLSLRCVKDVN